MDTTFVRSPMDSKRVKNVQMYLLNLHSNNGTMLITFLLCHPFKMDGLRPLNYWLYIMQKNNSGDYIHTHFLHAQTESLSNPMKIIISYFIHQALAFSASMLCIHHPCLHSANGPLPRQPNSSISSQALWCLRP